MSEIGERTGSPNVVALPLRRAAVIRFAVSPYLSATTEVRVMTAFDRLKTAIRGRSQLRMPSSGTNEPGHR